MYCFTTTFDGDVYFALQRLSEELSKEGFDSVKEHDMQASLKKHLDTDILPYRLLTAYHAHYAQQVIEFDANMGLLLPCHIVVWETEDDDVVVTFLDPRHTLGTITHPSMLILAEALRSKLQRVCDNLVD